MARKIVPLIPPHVVYCEPFAGGAAVFYAKPRPDITNGHHYREVLNDMDGDLVNMYCVAMDSPDSFSSSVQAIPFSASLYKGCADIRGADRHRALAFFINIQQSFANKKNGGWRRSTFGRDSAKTWDKVTDNVKIASSRLRGVSLDSIDAVQFIQRWDSPHTFFYIDPPYTGTCIDEMGRWSADDDARLVRCLNQAKGSFILSGYHQEIETLRYAERMSFAANCTATGAGKSRTGRNHGEPVKGVGRERTEYIYMRGPAHPVRSSLIPVLSKQKTFTGPLLGPCPLPIQRQASG